MIDVSRIVAIPEELVMQKIFIIRGKKVMLDSDLAALYGVQTKVLKQQVRRNMERFPPDFMFELDVEEFENLRAHFTTSSRGGTRYLPLAFTEQGVAMLSSVLGSQQAIQVNIRIIRIFTKMREMIATHRDILQKLEQIERKELEQDEKIVLLFHYLEQLEKARQEINTKKKPSRIGFNQSDN
jgi:hypothetical protein